MTKRAAALIRKQPWNRAIAEGRMVRFEHSMTMHATREAALQAVAIAHNCGLGATIVDPTLALREYLEDK